MGIIRFAVKSSVAGGIVYYTAQEGLWSTPDDTIKFYEKIYNNVTPIVKDYVNADIVSGVPTLPSASTMSNYARGMWNNGVKASFKFISELPTHLSSGIDSIMSSTMLQDSIQSIKGSDESEKAKSQ